MAQSKFLWIVEYEDEFDYVKAQNIYQIIECPHLSHDIDSITKIERLDLAIFSDDDDDTIIDIPFQD